MSPAWPATATCSRRGRGRSPKFLVRRRRQGAAIFRADRIAREFGDRFEIACDLMRFARTLAFAERAEAAAQLSRSDAMREELDLSYPP